MTKEEIEERKRIGAEARLRTDITEALWRAGNDLEAARKDTLKEFEGSLAKAQAELRDAEQLYAALQEMRKGEG